MTLHAPLHPMGARIRIRRGAFPLNPAWIGREGLVVSLDDDRPGFCGVVLDGEDAVRAFAEDELEPPRA